MDAKLNTIGKNIRALRQKQNWNQEQIAKRLHISIPRFSKIETGETEINISRLNQIAAVFNVGIHDILSMPDEHPLAENIKELVDCNNLLASARQEILELQNRLISLYDENRTLSNQLNGTL
jgi:transcriptional regulator with XRE-family HTH domain